MIDKEMFELAAKAAGIEGEFRWNGYGTGSFVAPTKDGDVSWNPRDDDGDALRLMVTLDIGGVFINKARGVSWVSNQYGDNIAEVAHDDAVNYDPRAATRRAIFIAAADIGKGMR